MTQTEETAVLQALAQLELKLTTLISSSLAQLQQQRSEQLLEQAKLNAAFAHREVVEAITRRVDAHAGELLRLNQQAERVTGQMADNSRLIAKIASDLDRRTLHLFTSATTYLFGAGALIAASVCSWALTHFFH